MSILLGSVLTIKVVIHVVPHIVPRHSNHIVCSKNYLEYDSQKRVEASVTSHILGWGGKWEPGKPGYRTSSLMLPGSASVSELFLQVSTSSHSEKNPD